MEIYRLFLLGNSIKSLSDIDSNPKDFIKIATFYHEAVKMKGEDFKKLAREGRRKTGGKTIIFERLFKSRKLCGYDFGQTGEIIVEDRELFTDYINAIVSYLIDNLETTSRLVDNVGTEEFLLKLQSYGFSPKKIISENRFSSYSLTKTDSIAAPTSSSVASSK